MQEWLRTYAKSNTKRVFLAGVRHFLESVYGKIENLEELANQYINECKNGKRDWFKDLLAYAAKLQERPPKSARAYMSGAKSWLEFTLNIELTRKQNRLLLGRLPKGSRARTEEAELTREVLRAILAHCDLKGKAFFTFLASSGVRLSEALKLRIENVNFNVDPVQISVPGAITKSGNGYTTFITSEAKELLEQWLKVRESYIESAINRGAGLGRIKNREDPRLFPFSRAVAEQMWYTAIEKAGLNHKDPSTKRYRLHVHMLRKWFISQAKLVVPESLVESWAGHSVGLDQAYTRYSLEQMREYYKKAEPYLMLNIPRGISEIQSKFQKDVDDLRNQIIDLTRKLTDANAMQLRFMNENNELRAKIAILEKELIELKSMLLKLMES
jgi:integrase